MKRKGLKLTNVCSFDEISSSSNLSDKTSLISMVAITVSTGLVMILAFLAVINTYYCLSSF
jgi:hypothetical protein